MRWVTKQSISYGCQYVLVHKGIFKIIKSNSQLVQDIQIDDSSADFDPNILSKKAKERRFVGVDLDTKQNLNPFILHKNEFN